MNSREQYLVQFIIDHCNPPSEDLAGQSLEHIEGLAKELQELLSTPPVTSVEENKSATAILAEYGIDLMQLDDKFNSQLLAAMEAYKNQPAPTQSVEEASGKSAEEWFDDNCLHVDIIGQGIITKEKFLQYASQYSGGKAPAVESKAVGMDVLFNIPLDIEGSNIGVVGWMAAKEHFPPGEEGVKLYEEAVAEYKKQNEKVLFSNVHLNWDSCDCGDGYGCSHGSWVYARCFLFHDILRLVYKRNKF